MRVLQLRDSAKVTSLQFSDMRLRLALQRNQMSKAFGMIASAVVHRGIRLQRAGQDAEHGDPAGKRVRDGLPDESGIWASIAGANRRGLAALRHPGKRALS